MPRTHAYYVQAATLLVCLCILAGCSSNTVPPATAPSLPKSDPFRLDVSSDSVTGAQGDRIWQSLTFTNESDAPCIFGIYFGNEPNDCSILQVSPDGVRLASNDPNRLPALSDMKGGGSSYGEDFAPHSSYCERVELSHLFQFPKSGKWFFRARVDIGVAGKHVMVMSRVFQVVIFDSPVSGWKKEAEKTAGR
jgi:hypothetical protein